jgi:hypothetical protein
MRADLKRSLLRLASGQLSANDFLADADANYRSNGSSVSEEVRRLAGIHRGHVGRGEDRESANANRDLVRHV